MYSFYQLLFFFMIYAVFGWCLEVVYQALELGKFINRGFLNGPYCPIYGFGVIIVTVSLNPLKENIIILYVGSVLLTTALEFVTGFVLEKIFQQKWWDYSEEHFNIKGYVCLKFSLLWGVACLVVVRLIHPFILRFVNWIPHTVGIIVLIILFAGFTSDMIITVMGILNIRKKIKLLNAISAEMRKISDFSGEKLYDAVTEIREKGEALSEKNEVRKEKLEALRVKYKNALNEKSHTSRRIESAFPKLKAKISESFKEKAEEFRNENNRRS